MTGLTYGIGGVSWTETNTFNALGQLTRQAIPSVIDFEYTFSATANNGQIEKQKDWITGDEQNYTYDALKRLTMAWTTGPDYGLSFGYDGFGNKLSQTVTKGSAPAMSITVDAYNHITGQTYDANGNMTSGASSTLTYDVDNRVVTASGLSSESYSYDPGNKRIWKKRALGGGSYAEDVYFYGIGTGRLGIYTKSGGSYSVKSADVRFAGKLIYTNSAWVVADRLGSIRYRKPSGTAERLDSFPYGEERPSATAQDRDKFATYMRDDTGLDYADQRYFTNTSGRFVTPDPAGDGSNWYAYAGGDPVNNGDPTGMWATFDYYGSFGAPFQAVVEPPQPEMAPPDYVSGGFGVPVGSDSESGSSEANTSVACGDLRLDGNSFSSVGQGASLSSLMTGDGDTSLLARVIFAESDSGGFNTVTSQDNLNEKVAIALSIQNRVSILGGTTIIGGLLPATLGWGPLGATLGDVLSAPGQYQSISGGDINGGFWGSLRGGLKLDSGLASCRNLAYSYFVASHYGDLPNPFGSEIVTSFHAGESPAPLEKHLKAFGASPNHFFAIVPPTYFGPIPRPNRPGIPPALCGLLGGVVLEGRCLLPGRR